MSTNAYIMMEHAPTPVTGETITLIYCHLDGYIEGAGETLFEHYQDPEKVKALLELGDILSLGEFLAPKKGQTHTLLDPTPNTSVAYHRDRGDNYDDVKPKEFTEKELACTLLDPTTDTTLAYHSGPSDNYNDVKPKEFTGNKPALKWRFQEYNYFFGLDKKWYLVIVHPGIEKLWMIELYNYLV